MLFKFLDLLALGPELFLLRNWQDLEELWLFCVLFFFYYVVITV